MAVWSSDIELQGQSSRLAFYDSPLTVLQYDKTMEY